MHVIDVTAITLQVTPVGRHLPKRADYASREPPDCVLFNLPGKGCRRGARKFSAKAREFPAESAGLASEAYKFHQLTNRFACTAVKQQCRSSFWGGACCSHHFDCSVRTHASAPLHGSCKPPQKLCSRTSSQLNSLRLHSVVVVGSSF
jgi:hypothetical protein